MDLSTLDVVSASNQGATLELIHPVTEEKIVDDDGNVMSITVLGTDSQTYRDILKARTRQRLNQKKQSKIDLDEAEHKGLELLARCTMGWANIYDEGEKVPFSFEAALNLYKKYPWIKEQVDNFMADRSNFLKG